MIFALYVHIMNTGLIRNEKGRACIAFVHLVVTR